MRACRRWTKAKTRHSQLIVHLVNAIKSSVGSRDFNWWQALMGFRLESLYGFPLFSRISLDLRGGRNDKGVLKGSTWRGWVKMVEKSLRVDTRKSLQQRCKSNTHPL
ncbi:hypothetical protein CEXT_457641 [Caerostris extrusa]|uniref:Uncharacterized protein n=1 Tax=Caerostris extrusa TaxID=172846 RepID=A0AAV4Q3A9_CAEEX|nr:hypothetical protein CEXT_457641 [Caerostris extrusa]